jgi:hypothetical protein
LAQDENVEGNKALTELPCSAQPGQRQLSPQLQMEVKAVASDPDTGVGIQVATASGT